MSAEWRIPPNVLVADFASGQGGGLHSAAGQIASGSLARRVAWAGLGGHSCSAP